MISSLQELVDTGARKTHEANQRKRSFTEFLEEEIHTDNGPWSYRDHEALRGIFELAEQLVRERRRDSSVTVLKGEQIGLSTGALGLTTWAAAEAGLNVGYFLPTRDFASSFGAQRFNPIVERSSLLSSIMRDSGVDRAQLKELNGRYVHMLGLESMLGAISVPMDLQFFDEVDFIPPLNLAWSRGRLAHSDYRVQFKLSAPYRPGAGIDQSYAEGSQRRWLVRCGSCGAEKICLEESFPECMREFNGTWVRVCPHCKRKIDVEKNGAWVATFPEREEGPSPKFSFRLSALSVPAIGGDYIMSRYAEAMEKPWLMPIFNRSIRALADAGNLQPITDAEIAKMRALGTDHNLILGAGKYPRFFGVDMGNICWFWCEEYLPDGRPRLVWAERINADRVVERVAQLIGRLQPQFGIIDERPLLTDARKIAYAFPRHVAVQEFVNGRELQVVEKQQVVEGEIGAASNPRAPKYRCVQIDRNDALEQLVAEITDEERGLILPKIVTPTLTLVAEHLKKLQKEETKDKRGNLVFKFLDGVENHFAMAACSARLARLVAPNLQPFSYTPIHKGKAPAARNPLKRSLLGG